MYINHFMHTGPSGEIMQFHHHRYRQSHHHDPLHGEDTSGLSPDSSLHGGASAMHTSASSASLASDGSGGNRSCLGAYLRPSNFSLHPDQGNTIRHDLWPFYLPLSSIYSFYYPFKVYNFSWLIHFVYKWRQYIKSKWIPQQIMKLITKHWYST